MVATGGVSATRGSDWDTSAIPEPQFWSHRLLLWGPRDARSIHWRSIQSHLASLDATLLAE